MNPNRLKNCLFTIIVFSLVHFSCDNRTTTVSNSIDTIDNSFYRLNNQDSTEIHPKEQLNVPNMNLVTINLKSAFRNYVDCIINEKYDDVIECLYPGYINAILKRIPNHDIDEVKDAIKTKMPEMYRQNLQPFISEYGVINGYNLIFRSVEKTAVRENKIAITYSKDFYIYLETDTIKSNEPQYGLAVSYDFGERWFFLDGEEEAIIESMKDDFTLEEINFILEQ